MESITKLDTMKSYDISESKPNLLNIIQILLVAAFFLFFMALFIFLGIQAFTTGTNFGAVINSLIPILASSALYQQSGTTIIRKIGEFKESVITTLKKIRVRSAV